MCICGRKFAGRVECDYVCVLFYKDDRLANWKNRMALFSTFDLCASNSDSLLTARVISEQDHDVIKQKT